ncbi:MAG TPA: PLP-dependent aminotransferase family protein [Pseudolysinimonas sp.]
MTDIKTGSGAGDFLVVLDRHSDSPLHHQLEAAIRDAIRSGRMKHGSQLPSSRVLADDLGVSRGVVIEAYQQLTAEGYILSRPGGYTQVSATQNQIETAHEPAPATRPRIDMLYGRPDVSQFPRAAWARAARRVVAEAPTDRLIYLDGFGAPELREALVNHLNRVRGTWASPENILICSGFAQAFSLISQFFIASGRQVLAVEDPSFDDVRPVASAAGLEIIGIPVDESGLDVTELERSRARAVLVTPAHQLTGAVLSPERRTALIEWAHRTGGLIVEDDYDAEYRYDQEPVGALQGLAPDRVIYTGSASKTLAPGLRMGWIVAPAQVTERLAEAKVAADRGSSIFDQLTFADFLNSGEFNRHLRRMRPIYRSRRDVLLRELTARLPELRPTGISAGLHLMAWLPTGMDEKAIVETAASRGLGLNGLGPHRIAESASAGLIFGYAKPDAAAIVEGVAILASVIHAAE